MPLWDFELDYGRQGTLSGTFEATEQEVKDALGKKVWWGDELGKHSEGEFIIEEGMITPHSASIRGFNPLDNIEEE